MKKQENINNLEIIFDITKDVCNRVINSDTSGLISLPKTGEELEKNSILVRSVISRAVRNKVGV